jgi:hypothetical protein
VLPWKLSVNGKQKDVTAIVAFLFHLNEYPPANLLSQKTHINTDL